MIGILGFLIVVVLVNILSHYISNSIYTAGTVFLNQNFWLLLLIFIIMLTASVFLAFPFPLNLPGPIIRAIGSVFIIAFILRVFDWVDGVTSSNIYQAFWLLSFLIVPLVFLIVLASGYLEMLRQLWRPPAPVFRDDNTVILGHPPDENSPPVSDAKSWEEIGYEFRLVLYDLMHRFRQEIRRK